MNDPTTLTLALAFLGWLVWVAWPDIKNFFA